MPIQILMPALSPTMTEGNLVKWHKNPGDKVQAGQVLAEIETDKATMEVEAVDEGVMGKILVAAGTEGVKVNQLIALLLEDGEDPKVLEEFKAPKVSTPAAPAAPAPVEATPAPIAPSPAPQAASTYSGDRVLASPLAKRIAEQRGIPLNAISGTGPRGRIIKDDVLNANPLTSMGMQLVHRGPRFVESPMSSMRKTIAKRLVESKQQVPHFYLSADCQIGKLLEARKTINDEMGTKISVNDFVIKACGLALKKVPAANMTYEGAQAFQYLTSDISVAVAIEGGLITPIVKDAQLKSLATISSEMKELASRARDGKLKPEEYTGGSFSISNLGMYGVKQFQAIINPPQGCILAVGAGEERAVVRNGQLTVATMMTVTLSVDHRIIDGAVGAEFLKALKNLIEEPVLLLL